LIFLLCALQAGVCLGANWPGWRGPAGTGVCTEIDLPLHWDAAHSIRWRTPLPDRGNSTPVVWENRVFVTQATEKDHRRSLLCLNRVDGRVLWQAGVTWGEHEPTNAQNPYCSSSPVTDGQRVIAYFGSAGLYCYDFSGKEQWHRDIGAVDSWQGSGSSPMLHGNLCIVNAGPGTHAALIAVNKQDGSVAWKVSPPKVPGRAITGVKLPVIGGFDNAFAQADPSGAGGFLGSWSTPIVIRERGRDELIVVHPYQVSAYEPETGKEIWSCTGLPGQAFASPVVGDGMLVVCGHKLSGGGTRVTGIWLDDSAGSHRIRWQTDFPKDCVGSGVIAHGRVYLPTQFGSMLCLDLPSGRKLWEKRLAGEGTLGGCWSSIVIAGDRLLIPNQSGEVFILSTTSDHFDLVARNSMGDEPTCASLSISDGQIFLRTYKALWCIGR